MLTNRGARLKSWRLKRYFDVNHEPLELVATELASTHPLPFSLRVSDERATAVLNGALYAISNAPPAGTGPIARSVDVRFEYRDTTGLSAIKEFHLDPSSYVLGFRAEVTKDDQRFSPTIQWGPAVRVVESSAGRQVIDVTPATASILMMVTAVNPQNYLRNMHVWMPGTELRKPARRSPS